LGDGLFRPHWSPGWVLKPAVWALAPGAFLNTQWFSSLSTAPALARGRGGGRSRAPACSPCCHSLWRTPAAAQSPAAPG